MIRCIFVSFRGNFGQLGRGLGFAIQHTSESNRPGLKHVTYRRHVTTAELTAKALPFVSMGLGFPVLIIAAYCVKSAIGIDLFDGPSIFHAWFYWG